MKLYIKKHQKTGLKYFGFTRSDNLNYNGSGKYWKLHLQKHGKDIMNCDIVETDNQKYITAYAVGFSIANDIVESKEWANLQIENAQDGIIFTDEIRQKMKVSRAKQVITEEAKEKISKALKGIKRPTRTQAHKDNLSKALQGIKKEVKYIKCPYCEMESNPAVMKRWHFDNCKYNIKDINDRT